MYSLLAIISAILWGIWAFGIGQTGRGVSRWMVILISEAVAGLIYVVFGSLTGDLVFDREDILPGVIGGLLNLAGNILILQAYARGKLGVAAGVRPSYVLVPLAYSIAIGEALKFSVALGVVTILVGLVMFGLASPRFGPSGGVDLTQVLLAVGAALAYGVGIVVMDIGSRTSVYGTLAMSMVPMLLLTAVIAAATKSFGQVNARTFWILAGSGVALGGGAVLFYTAADLGDLGLVSVLGSLSPIVTALLAFAFLRERLSRLEIGAMAVVLVGVAVALA
jgi:drug/metabolite transporter (DMT)-like permease